MAISGGILESINDNGDETRTFHWKFDTPHPSHLLAFVVGSYKNYQQKFEDIKINNYGYPDEYFGTKESVISLPDMMKYYSDYTGIKYPFPQYSQIFVQDFGGWKGSDMSSIITENMIDDKTTHKDFLYLWDVVEGEALAFQWFGNYLKPSCWEDIWLAKAFSRHLSGLYNQHANGNEEYQVYQHRPDLLTYLGDWNSNTSTIVIPKEIHDLDSFVNGNSPYIKGALVLNMLRKEIGEKLWERLVQGFISDYGGKLVTTENFIDKVNEVVEKPMEWFFYQWVYGIGHPNFRIKKSYDREAETLSLTVVQTQTIDSLVHGKKIPLFMGKIRIEIDNKIEEVNLKPAEKNTFVFPVMQEPKLVNFDYEDVWIKESVFHKTTDELLTELKSTTDILHRVSVMTSLTQMATSLNTSADAKSKIINTLFEIVDSEMYWRNRLFAIWQLHNIFTTNSPDGIARLNHVQESLLIKTIKSSTSWVKANAINFLGDTRNKTHTQIYLAGLNDYSDRVTFMSAMALGKTEDPRAFEALMYLSEKPSWKNQSLISAMYGLKELKDSRAYDFVLKTLVNSDDSHWNLGTPIWDHRLAAALTLVELDKVEEGYDAIYAQFKDAFRNNDMNDIFYNVQQVSILGDPRGKEVFEKLKKKFEKKLNVMKAIKNLENNFSHALNSRQ